MKQVLQLTFSLLFLTGLTLTLSAQMDKANRPSPPAEASGMIGDAKITVNYSSPAVKDRDIWGGLVSYDKVWRAGANEATTFETSADIMVNGSNLPAGKYGVWMIPGKDTWTVIFNKGFDQWGSNYDKSKDVLRVDATPAMGDFQERLQFMVSDGQVVLAWEKLKLPLTITTM